MAVGTDRISTVDIKTEDFTSQSFFPYAHKTDKDKVLVHGFISSNRVSDFAGSIKLKILSVLMPDLGKGTSSVIDEQRGSQSNPPRGNQPPAAQPQGPPQHIPPTAGPQAGRYFPPENPLAIGRRDLDPIPMNPFAPPSLFGPNRNDGMFVGPDHPIFDARRRDPFGGEPTGPWGGDGFLPPMGAPPGARLDPVGPGPWPRGGRNRGPLGDPSNDEFMPPGFDNDAHMPPPPGSRDMFM